MFLTALLKQDSSIIWLGPIQGGKYLDLIEKSAKTISSIDTFGMFAVGSVVEIKPYVTDFDFQTDVRNGWYDTRDIEINFFEVFLKHLKITC